MKERIIGSLLLGMALLFPAECGFAYENMTLETFDSGVLPDKEENIAADDIIDELFEEDDASSKLWLQDDEFLDGPDEEAFSVVEWETENLEALEEVSEDMTEAASETELSTDELFELMAAEGDDMGEGDDYSYVIHPLLMPFNNLYYIETDNPDPTSFRFVDRSSRFITDADSSGLQSGLCCLLEKLFQDVKYVDEETFRVNGGYIFYNYNVDIDGGDLLLQRKNGSTWYDTGSTVSCPEVMNMQQYLLDYYTDESMSFFEKLDAVERGIYQWALYPRSVYDSSTPSSTPYPFLASSPYAELSLNDHYNIYNVSERGSLVTSLYPFILDSASFPGTISAIARKLDSSCTIEVGEVHWHRRITLNGETHTYGFAGDGDDDPIYSHQLTSFFTFDGSDADLYSTASLEKLKQIYKNYGLTADENVKELKAQISGEQLVNEIGPGCWIRIAIEGWGRNISYGYIARGYRNNASIASDAWVDGRYISQYERIEPGAKFEDHPTADIIMRNVSYVDYKGNEHANDIVYSYDSSTDTWRAARYYTNGYYYTGTLPDTFILTREQVEQMAVDGMSNSVPEAGKIYDGSAYPGTPFGNIIARGISMPEKMTIEAGETVDIPVVFEPEDTTHQLVIVTSDDTEVLYASHGSPPSVFGYKPGTVTVHAVSRDGGFGAACEVTVIPREVALKEGTQLEAGSINYGKPLSYTYVYNQNFVDKKTGYTVRGTFALDDPDVILEPGVHAVSWTFTPSSERYKGLSGTVEITVNKLTPSLWIYSAPRTEEGIYTETQTLKDVAIIGVDTDVKGVWQWTDPTIVPEIGGHYYSCTFYPEDSVHYNTIERSVYVYMHEIRDVMVKEGTTVSASGIYDGEKLSSSYIYGTIVDIKDGYWIYGTFTFDNLDAVLPVGTHQVSWTFTPESQWYHSLKGIVSITVYQKSSYYDNDKYDDEYDDEQEADRLGIDGTAFGKGASVYTLENAVMNRESDSDPEGTIFAPLKLSSKSQGTSNIKLSWKRVSGAAAYAIYGNKCGNKNKMMYLGLVTGSSYNIQYINNQRLKAGQYYKFFVAALDDEGYVITSSKYIHVATKGGKVTNARRLKPAKKKISLKVGKKAKIKITTKKQTAGKLKTHRKLYYETTNSLVATVDKKGNVRATGKGNCQILVYAQNGISTKIKVTVK